MQLPDIAKKMVIVICVTLLLIIAASIVYYRSFAFLPFAFGAALGAGLNILKVAMLNYAVDRAVEMEEKGGNYIRIQYIVRLLLTGAVLILSVYAPFINLFGTVAGILTWQVASLVLKFLPSMKKDTVKSVND